MLPGDIEESPSIEPSGEPVSDEEAKIMETVELPEFGAPLELETVESSKSPAATETDVNQEDEASEKKESSDTSEEECESAD
jgi:hypothetical protein